MAAVISQVEVHHLRVSFAELYGSAEQVPSWVSHPAAHYQDSPRSGQESVIVRLRTPDGLDGVGESWALPAGAVTAAAVARLCAPLLIGQDPRRIEWLWRRMFDATSRLGHLGGVYLEALAGIDIALWDLLGKLVDEPVHVLLGGPTRQSVRVYAGSVPLRSTPEESAAHAQTFVDEGFRGIKVKVGRDADHDAAHVLAIRRQVGPAVPLMLDANGGYRLTDAVRLAQLTVEADIAWFEDPLPVHDVDGLSQLRRRTGVKIAAGENEHNRYGVRDLVTAGAIDVLVPNVTRMGGITELRKVAALCEAFDVEVSPHGVGSAVQVAAALQVAAAVPNLGWYEANRLPNPLRDELASTPQRPYDSELAVSTAPGIGLTLDESVLDRYRVGPPMVVTADG